MKCTLCNERNGNTRCEGCNTLFCLLCMTKHHDELVQQFQLLMDVRNEIKESLETTESTSSDGKRISCLAEINRWETEIIQSIQQIAAKARTNVNEILATRINEIRHRFERFSLDIQQRQKEGNYLENDIDRVKNQLDQLKNDIEHVNENIQIDTTLSNSIEWEALIYIAETELSSKATPEAIRPNNKAAKQKQGSRFSDLFSSSQKNDATSSSMSSEIKRSESSRIPVHVENSTSSTGNWSLNVICLICGAPFHGPPSMRICSECDRKMRFFAPRQSDAIRPTVTNAYLPTYKSGFAPVLSSIPNTQVSRIMPCPHCKFVNLSNDGMSGSDYYCDRCRNLITSAFS